MSEKRLTKKEKKYLIDSCFDELDSLKELKKTFRKEKKDIKEVDSWIRKRRSLLKELQSN